MFKDDILTLDVENIFPEYPNENIAIILIEKNKLKESKIFFKSRIMGKKTNKSLIIKNKETLTYEDFKFRCAIGRNGITKNKIEGDVFIQFSIDQYGYLIDFTTIGPDRILEDEAYRIMSSLLVSKPATFNGKNVKITYGIPISFRLN